MSLIRRPAAGYYDECGQWQRTKYCFVSCGARCICLPPGGQQYSPAHDKRPQSARTAPDEQFLDIPKFLRRGTD